MAKFGNAAILWTSTEDANTERVFLLDQPLVEVTPAHNQAVYRRESLDRSAMETYTVGSGAYELEGTIRYSADPDGLVEMLKAGSQGKTLRYVPNLADYALHNSCLLVSPMSPTQATLDAQRGMYGEQQVTIRLRRAAEEPFTGQAKGTEVIFAYRAGGGLRHGVSTGTFARVTSTSAPASYASISTGDLGYGTISTAATNKARISWMANPTSVGPRTFPVLLLEKGRTNLIAQSEQFTSAGGWTLLSGAVVTTGQADPKGGTRAALVVDSSTSFVRGIRWAGAGLAPSTYAVLSAFVKQGTTVSSSGAVFNLRTTGLTSRIRFRLTWSSGVPTVAYTAGVSAAPSARWRNGWWRIAGRTTATFSSATLLRLEIWPGGSTATAGNKGDLYLYGTQVEQ